MVWKHQHIPMRLAFSSLRSVSEVIIIFITHDRNLNLLMNNIDQSTSGLMIFPVFLFMVDSNNRGSAPA